MNQTEHSLAISVPQAAKFLGVSRYTAYALARRKDFPAFQVGGRILVSTAGLAAWVERQTAEKSA